MPYPIASNLKAKGGYSAIVYKKGSKVIAEDNEGKVIAKGEAGVDDASVIQSALDVGGRVFIAKGEYLISKTLIIKSNTSLIGEGIGLTKIKLANGVNKDIIQTYAEANQLDTQYDENIVITNLEIDGNGANQSAGMGLNIENITKSKLINLYIHDVYGKAIRINTVGTKDRLVLEDIVIQNVILDTNYSTVDLASISAINGLQVNNFVVKNSQGSGSTTGSLINSSYDNIIAINNGAYGFSIEGWGEVHDISVNGVVVIGNQHGIVIESVNTTPYNINIRGIASRNSQDGLRIYGAKFVTARVVAYRNGWRGCFIVGGSKYCKIYITAIENGQAGERQYGVQINDEGTDYNYVDVLAVDEQAEPTQEYGAVVSSAGPPEYNTIVIQGYGNKTALYADYGSNTTIIFAIAGYKNSGTATFSGDGSTTQFSIEHGLVSAPSKVLVTPMTADASGDFYVTADDTYIYINYKTAPPSGTDNIKVSWYAEV